MCLKTWCVRNSKLHRNHTKQSMRDGARQKCECSRMPYKNTCLFILFVQTLSFHCLNQRDPAAALQYRRKESWVRGSHTKCAPVPSSSDAGPRSLTSLCQHLSSFGCPAQAFLHSESWFKYLYTPVQMPTGPLAVAQLSLPMLLDEQKGMQTQGLTSYVVSMWEGFLQAVHLCRSYSSLTGKKREGFCSMMYNKKSNSLLLIISGSQWNTSLLLAYAWL